MVEVIDEPVYLFVAGVDWPLDFVLGCELVDW